MSVCAGHPAVADCETREEQFIAFVSQHRAGLYRKVRVRVTSDHDAEDITQEALLRTWRRWDRHVDDRHRLNFAHLVARQLVTDLHRSKEHSTERRPAFDDDILGSAPCPSESVVRAEDRAIVAAALRRLPEQQRRLLIHCDVLELPLAELRAIYDVTGDVLKYRRFRARRALHRELERIGSLAVAPVLFFRKIAALRHRTNDVAAAPVANVAVVVVTTVSMLVGPFGSGGVLPPAAAAEPAQQVYVTAAPAALLTGVAAGPRAAATSQAPPAATPSEPAPPVSAVVPAPDVAAVPAPRVCVATTCVGDSDGNRGDVLTVHLPAGVGDFPVSQDVVPVCELVPDQPAAECRTEGNPRYVVPLPPR